MKMDVQGFESLARDVRPQLVRFLARMVGEADADDVAQATLSKAAAALSSFRGEARARSWLFRIAGNAARDWLRSHPRHEASDEAQPAELTQDAPQERRLVREQMSQCMGDFLRRLPESYQAVLELSDCEELSDREVAAILGVTEGAAKIRLHRARTRLKQELEAGCSFYRDDQNVLCCDPKVAAAEAAYRSDECARLQGERPKVRSPLNDPNEEHTMTAVEILPAKQKHLVAVGASIAAGCQPCTLSFASAAREAGACERGLRFAVDCGLAGRESATAQMASWAREKLPNPEVDAAFGAERTLLEALIAVASAVAANSAALVKDRVDGARSIGASLEQIGIAVEIGRMARRGAEREADSALSAALGRASKERCCPETPLDRTAGAGSCGCK